MTATITITPIGTQQLHTPFPISGTWTVQPSFEYKDNAGALVMFPAGSTEPPTTEAWTMQHPGPTTAGPHTVTIKEAVSGATAAASYTVVANAESPSGTVITPGVGTITLANGTGVTVTAGSQLNTQANVNAIMAAINTQQQAEVPGGETFGHSFYTQEALAGDIIIADSPHVQASGVRGLLTDKDGNVWGLVAGIPADTNPPAWWWGGIQLNGVLQWSGYNIAIRLTNDGQVWVEEAKGGGWWSLTAFHENPGATRVYVMDPGAGPNNTSGGGQLKFGNTVDTNTANVVLGVYWNHILYQHDSVVGGFWSGTLGSYTQINGSASGTTVTDGTGIILTATDNGSLVTLQGGQVWFNGAVDTTTANATLVLEYNGSLYHENTAGNWFTGTKGAWTGPLSGDPRLVVATGNFQIKNGQVIAPGGAVFKAKGVCMTDQSMVPASTLMALWPGLNIVNFALGSDFAGPAVGRGYVDAIPNSQIFSWVDDATSRGLVVVLSDYVAGQPGPRTGSDLTNMANWYAALAAHYVNNPRVWFLTSNEIAGPVGPMWTATYNAVRGAGNNNLVWLECAWGAVNHTFDADPSVPPGMTGVGYAGHCYPGNPTTPDDAGVRGLVSLWNNFAKSKDGVMPLFMSEQGPSSTGQDNSIDDTLVGGNHYQVMQAVDDVTTGAAGDVCAYTAWVVSFNGGGYTGDDRMLQANTEFTTPVYSVWGQQVKNNIAANPPTVLH